MVTRLLIAAAVLCASHTARADDAALAEARAHKAALRYLEAREVLDTALRAGGNTPGELAAIHRMLGEVAGGLDEPGVAEEHFKRLLALDPSATLQHGVSPKLQEPFDAARDVIKRLGSLSVRHEVTATGSIALIAESDPLGMVAGARARYRTGTETAAIDVAGSGRVEVALPGDGPFQVVLIALDGYGNQLAVLGSDAVPIEVRRSGVTARAPGRSFATSPWLWASVASGFAAAGIAFGIVSQRAEDDLARLNRESMDRPFEIDFAEADDLKRRGERFAIAANISYGAAAAAAVLSVVFLVRGEPVGVSPTAVDGGAGASLSIRF